ncbi:uncharacterized protein V1510DRAFT_414053 [Dipodascopsis tothii]|uniref:uncharacterized protein n=1 Tax=Dipodascopsis tothii TaxID=44089 RepID=UPI0034CF0E1E
MLSLDRPDVVFSFAGHGDHTAPATANPPYAKVRRDRLAVRRAAVATVGYQHFAAALRKRLTDDAFRRLHRHYLELPWPRPLHMQPHDLERFLARNTQIRTVTDIDTFRYLSLLDDMKECKMPISYLEWCRALVLLTLGPRKAPGDLADALAKFREMEEYGMVADTALPFNAMTYLAVKTGRTDTARGLLAEMARRGIEPDDYTDLNRARLARA